jgi:hypothetical protein
MSGGAIFMVDGNGRLVEMREQPYDDELVLQKLLADHPHLLAGDQMGDGPARRWLLVSREMPVMIEDEVSAYGYLDHLFLDQDAVPTLVEVKRSSDMRIRREVVGQMLDYAANAARYWPVERMREYFGRRFREDPGAVDNVLAEFLGGQDAEDFWQRTKTNLQAGKVRLVFVADVIPSSLRAIIEFLNGQMDPAEVLGVEVRQYVGGEMKTLVPRLIGWTAAADAKNPQLAPWTEARFRARLREKTDAGVVEVADRIIAWARQTMPDFWYGRGKADGSIVPRLWVNGQRYLFFALYSSGVIELSPQWMKTMPGFGPDERRREYLERISRIPGVSVPLDAIARRPSLPIALLQSGEALQAFFAAIQWAISVAREAAEQAPDGLGAEVQIPGAEPGRELDP